MVLNVDVTHVAHSSLAIGGGTGLLKGAAVKQVSLLAIYPIRKLVAVELVLCGLGVCGMQI
jgi:hypothetical protein